jgi:dipeptidyl aminopeptidase/acylaminoacyl peptidase
MRTDYPAAQKPVTMWLDRLIAWGELMRLLSVFVSGCLAWCGLAAPAMAKPPLAAFGDMPAVRSPDISADGKHVAYISRVDGIDYLAKYEVATGKNEALIRLPDVKALGAYWVGSNYVILLASKVTTNSGLTKRYEDTSAFAYNISTRKIVQLLVGTQNLYSFQSGLGRIVGIDPGGQHVYMPAYIEKTGGDPTFDLLKVNLETGHGARIPGATGTTSTVSWIMNNKGDVIARTEFSEKRSLYEIRAYAADGGDRVIYSETTKLPSLGIAGFAERDGALVAFKYENSEFPQMYEISLADGTLSGPLKTREGVELAGAINDENKVVMGVSYSGLYPSYELFDETLNREIKAAMAAMPDAAVSLVSWTDDWSKVLLYAEGGVQPPRYMLYDRPARRLSPVARARPDIKPEEVAEVVTVEYKARDGLAIPTLITWPVGVPADQRKNLPMVVVPHGGPESYDSVGFDWLAQFLANEGYVVLQPNFRGSGGFGAGFAQAGYGEWGRKMQDDVTDGAQALIRMGWADPNRTCILGWSYGGYAALAGGALTPDLYKCVVSIAGVSDLKTMLGHEKREHGHESRTYAYWKSVIGDPDKDSAAIEAVSPYRLAANFKAPVLLIHGTDDLVVPDRHSDLMEQALKSANKPVTYIRVGKDDHNLAAPESRTRALSEIATFLKKHLGE